MKSILFILIIFFSGIHTAQTDSIRRAEWYNNMHSIERKGMLVLGSSAALQLITGTIGGLSASTETSRSFYQMNAMWNSVNAALAVTGLLRKNQVVPTTVLQALQLQTKKENIFLVNALLDITYATFGYALLNKAQVPGQNSARLKGFGNSLILQGAVLCVFDFTMYRSIKKLRLNTIFNW